MGIITLLLITSGLQEKTDHVEPQLWVVLLCHAAMGLGTLSGGWRIVKTMGMKITKLKPVGGFCAETSGAVTLALAVFMGVPVSTTHTITGSIVGVGASTGSFSAVRWGVAGRIVWAWVFTIPAAAAVASASYLLLRKATGAD
jgi:PiT family inorganic phosphate transporter